MSGSKLRPDRYSLAGAGIFLVLVVAGWKSHVISHEMIYLLGSRRVAEPPFLAFDFTWSKLPPTTFLFDHLFAPLWSFLGEFAIVNAGRAVAWALTAWSLARLARTLRLPAWSPVAGLAVWLAWGQTLADCGAPFEGLQVKSFAYPLVFLALELAMRGRFALSGACAGLAAAFHIVVGGWGFLATAIALPFAKEGRAPRAVAAFLLSAAPFLAPLVLATSLFVESGVTAEERATVDGIYVTVAAPACCQLDEFMTPKRWVRAGVVFAVAALLIFRWRERRPALVLCGFVAALAAFFLAGEVAQRLELYGLLKLFPLQLGVSLPALFLFTFFFGWAGSGRAIRELGLVAGALASIGTAWLVLDRDVPRNLAALPGQFLAEIRRPHWGDGPDEPDNGTPALYAWIRTNTPRESVFVTPLLKDFWPYAERAQVASRRHPPFDRRLIEWTERLQAMNELDLEGNLVPGEGDLSLEELAELRARYGATHYLVAGDRPDLAGRSLCAIDGFAVYSLETIGGPTRPAP